MTLSSFLPLFLLAFIVTLIARYIYRNNTDPIPYEEEEQLIKDLEEQETQARNLCKALGIGWKLENLNSSSKVVLDTFIRECNKKYCVNNTSVADGQKKYLLRKEAELTGLHRKLENLHEIEASGVELQIIEELTEEEKRINEIGNILSDDDFN